MDITIEETTVEIINDVRVSVGNIGRGEYALPDGDVKKGRSATLFYLVDEETEVSIGEGSEIEIGGQQWRVTQIKKPLFGGRGSVVMKSI